MRVHEIRQNLHPPQRRVCNFFSPQNTVFKGWLPSNTILQLTLDSLLAHCWIHPTLLQQKSMRTKIHLIFSAKELDESNVLIRCEPLGLCAVYRLGAIWCIWNTCRQEGGRCIWSKKFGTGVGWDSGIFQFWQKYSFEKRDQGAGGAEASGSRLLSLDGFSAPALSTSELCSTVPDPL